MRGDETSDGAVLQQALKGYREREWEAESGYDFSEIKKKIVEWMKKTEDWTETKYKLEKGSRFAKTLDGHIRIFKLVAETMGNNEHLMVATDVATK